MIFVTTGTVSFPFKRLVDGAVVIWKNKPEEVVIQAGNYVPANESKNIKLIKYLTLFETIEYYQKSRLVVSAAGEASVFMMLKYCKYMPILFPRQKRYGEHVDDQQLEIAVEAKRLGYAELALSEGELKQLSEQFNPRKVEMRSPSKDHANQLIQNLDRLVAGIKTGKDVNN